MATKPGFYGGIPTMQQFNAPGELSPRMRSTSEAGEDSGPNWRYGGLLTYEKPITEWFGDISIPVNAAGSSTSLRAGSDLPNNCVGVRFMDVTPGVWVSINGQGLRKVFGGDSYGNTEIQSLEIITDATGTCIVQPAGTGD